MPSENQDQKKISEYTHKQLPLPFLFPPEPNYSNTIELYDAAPKYVWGRIPKKNRIAGQFLDSIKKNFEFRKNEYILKITPARIESKDGTEMDYFPGEKEELVEDALRKMASDGKGLFLDDQAGVVFTLYELQQELKKVNHTYSLNQIKEALLICQGTRLSLESVDGNSILPSQMFETVGLHTLEDWKGTGKKTKCYVRFNILVTKSIKEKTFRPINYNVCMKINQPLGRWFNKRLSHNYTQASYNNDYHIMLSTIIRDSGVKVYAELRNNLRQVYKALDEIKEVGIIKNYKENRILEGRKIIDVKFILTPSARFIKEMKKNNALIKQLKASVKT